MKIPMLLPATPPFLRQATTMTGLLVAICLVAACQSPRQHIIGHESDLAAAGFQARPANTAERQALLTKLPPYRFVQRVKDDQIHYVYADPTVCSCLYVGTQDAYSHYQQNILARQQAKQLESALKQRNNAAEDDDFNAQIYSDPAFNWEAWGPWGY
jgi:hypothetical protein